MVRCCPSEAKDDALSALSSIWMSSLCGPQIVWRRRSSSGREAARASENGDWHPGRYSIFKWSDEELISLHAEAA